MNLLNSPNHLNTCMTDSEFTIPPLGGEGTKISITRGGKTTLLAEGLDYDINDQEVTFREGVLSPLPDIVTTTDRMTVNQIEAKYPLTPEDCFKPEGNYNRILVKGQPWPELNGVVEVSDETNDLLNRNCFSTDAAIEEDVSLRKLSSTKDCTHRHSILVKGQTNPLDNGIKFVDDATYYSLKKTSCDLPCSPSDFYEGGKCDQNGCFTK